MINKQFEAYKIRREIKRSGETYTFKRPVLNEFGEPSGDEIEVGSLRGLYHEQYGNDSNIRLMTGDTTQIRTKKMPMILCIYEDAKALNLHLGDKLYLNGRILKVVSLVNIQEWNIIGDLSLEEVATDVVQS